MPVKIKEREYRNASNVMAIESENNEKIVEGYASTFGEPYTLYEDSEYRIDEVVDARAFDKTDMSDVIMQYNHEGHVYARIKNNTLSIRPDDRGLFIRADLGGTPIGEELYAEVAGGYTDKMSFGFTVTKDMWTEEERDGKTVSLRTILEIGKLYDVSAVSIPANDATSISARNLADGAIAKIKAERQHAEEVRRAAELAERREKIKARAKK